MKRKEKLTAGDLIILQQAVRIAHEDSSLLAFATSGRIDALQAKLKRLEQNDN